MPVEGALRRCRCVGRSPGGRRSARRSVVGETRLVGEPRRDAGRGQPDRCQDDPGEAPGSRQLAPHDRKPLIGAATANLTVPEPRCRRARRIRCRAHLRVGLDRREPPSTEVGTDISIKVREPPCRAAAVAAMHDDGGERRVG